MISPPYPRDLVGYGEDVPHARWPDGARMSVVLTNDFNDIHDIVARELCRGL